MVLYVDNKKENLMELCLRLGYLRTHRRLALARPNSERRARERRPNFG